MKTLKYAGAFLLFLSVYLLAFALYQLPEAPTKFIYFNF